MYKKILVTSTGEYLDEIIEHALDLIHGRPMEVIGLYVADTSAPFLTPRKRNFRKHGTGVQKVRRNKLQADAY